MLDEWDNVKNEQLTPENVTYGSQRQVWWMCENGHSWQARAYARTTGNSRCPYCTKKRAVPQENSLGACCPEIAAKWHPNKNGELSPYDVLCGSHRKVWWLCPEGHEWEAQVKSRVGGNGCPICKHRRLLPGVNDLTATHPQLIPEWHPTRNGHLKPNGFVSGSHRKVWWICQYGHEWQAAILSRAGGSGCPVCAGKVVVANENDLASTFPAIAAQWIHERNGELKPDRVTPYSNRKVWWRCHLGHEYQAAVAARTNAGSGCPYCAGKKVLPGFNDLKTKYPEVAAQWHPTLNGSLTPEMVTFGSRKKVWWKCLAGHIWKAVISSRTCDYCGCPICAGKKTSPYYDIDPVELEQKILESMK